MNVKLWCQKVKWRLCYIFSSLSNFNGSIPAPFCYRFVYKRASRSAVSYTNSKSFYTIVRLKFVKEDFAPLVNTFTQRYLTAEHRNEWSYTFTPLIILCHAQAELYFISRKFVNNKIFTFRIQMYLILPQITNIWMKFFSTTYFTKFI